MIGLISAISIVLCMSFPWNISPNFIFDFRQVPFIIGILYGGRKVGLTLLFVLLGYRYFLGLGEGFYTSIIIYPLIFLAIAFFSAQFRSTTNFSRKMTIAIGANVLSILLLITVVSFFKVNLSVSGWVTLILFYITQVIVMFLFIYFIERAKEENYILSELNELEKLKMVSDMAASISHEVRNPLTVTKGFLQLLQDPSIPFDKKDFYLRLSLNELERAEIIISDYLTFAKPSLENVVDLNVAKELEYVVKVVTPYATMRNVTINVNTSENVKVAGERQKFHQCLINLAKNGIEAMPEQGQLTLTLSETETEAVITIEDTGIGMSEDHLKRLATPYYSTKTSGTGLGTMVVYSIIKAMNGQIQVESKENVGTRFILSIPKVT
ncbi:sporulation kinase B homolog 1 [Halalkalibacter wakoensis JCM 9140]|uniref:histidine kinase n=2 Tax=Halalkalibacter wakoensis TaxID=127891 RepID=W4Q305_9BACI|nr:sporulation kinase B homolog 1 [Halalkalibacter wakoensis JCM 9140]